MRISNFLLFVILLFILVISVSAADSLRFDWDFSKQEYTVFKGSSVNIDYSITNQEEFEISCTVTSKDAGTQTLRLNGLSPSNNYFTYSAPNKIKNLQNPTSYDVTVYCTGTYSYACGFLWFDTCYEPREFSFPKTVKIRFELSEQDKRNLKILEEYKGSMDNKVTDIDEKNQELNELITKTPTPILPENTKQQHSMNQEQINPIINRFDNVVKALEDEEYNLGSTISLSTDSRILTDIETKITNLKSAININIERYNQIVKNLNEILAEVKTEADKLNYKFNSELIKQLNSLGTETLSKITNYDFVDLNEAESIVQTYSTSKDNLLYKMKKNLEDYSNKGVNIIKNEVEKICSNFKLCDTKNKIQLLNLETTKSIADLCTSYNDLFNEIKIFNENEAKRYKMELDDLNRKNKEIENKNEDIQKRIDSIHKTNELKDSLNLKAKQIEELALSSLKKANLIGKTVDLSEYSRLVEEYNSLTLEEKENQMKELEKVVYEIKSTVELLTSQENQFISFFKKIYYGLFRKKQELEPKLKLESKGEPPELIPQLLNDIVSAKKTSLQTESIQFFSDLCGTSTGKLDDLKADDMKIEISEKESQIKTNVIEPEKSCFNENGQRTTQCCDGEEYKFREDLYPVIFVHGHAMETGRGDVQNSLSTFNYISDYFSEKGYVEKSLLYPESSEDLVSGSWAYCNKPVAIKLTYYEGLKTGTTHNYKESIADYSPILKDEINSVLKATNKDKTIIVAHSMGGILSRYYIKFDGGSSKVHKLVTLGSPHYGVRPTLVLASPFGAKESKQMTPNSDFLNNLNNPNDSLVPTYTISGNNNGCMLEDCDGVVHVSDSKLKNARDSKVFNGPQYKHSLMLQQSDVAQQVLDFVKN